MNDRSSTNPIRLGREFVVEAPTTFSVLPKEFVGTLQVDNQTPNVANLTKLIAKNVDPVTVTDFLGGQDGQSISILGDGNTTVEHSSRLSTNTGVDKLLDAGKIYRFTQINRNWYEDA